MRTVTLRFGQVEAVMQAVEEIKGERPNADTLVDLLLIVQALRPHYHAFVDARNEKVHEYAPEGRDVITPGDEGWKAFSEELRAVTEREIELQIPQLRIADLWRRPTVEEVQLEMFKPGERVPLDLSIENALRLGNVLLLEREHEVTETA